MSANRLTQGTASSRRFQTRPKRPSGSSTRWISARASGARNQWNAWPAVTACTLRSLKGMASATPATTAADGTLLTSCCHIPARGSTARGGGVLLPHHQRAAEVAPLLAALVEALRLDGHNASVGLRLRFDLVQHARLRVDRVAVKRRPLVGERLHLEVEDARSTDV